MIDRPAPPARPAERFLSAFARRFGEAHLDFACHAAVPMALTPELAYQIWTTFRVDCQGVLIGAPWIAVADLLLSELCSEVGPELYELRPEARRALVARLRGDSRFGEARLREVARFLLLTAESGIRTRDPFASSLATSQRWAALAYTEPARAAALIAEAMSELSALDPMGWARMEALLKELDGALTGQAPLRSLAAAMAELGRGKTGALEKHLSEHGQAISVAGRELAVPQEALNAIAPPAEQDVWKEGGVWRDGEVWREAVQAQEADRSQEATPAPVEQHRSRGLSVLVVGIGSRSLPEEVRAAAEGLGAALARAGHTLITGGWPGVDEVVARAFSDALSAEAEPEERLLQITEGSQKPAFSGGSWVQAPVGTDTQNALERAQVVVGIAGVSGTMERLQLADQMKRHVVPLRWTGGAARDIEFIPDTAELSPGAPRRLTLYKTRRVRRMLELWGLRDLNVERLTARAMAVIELAFPAKEGAFRRYNDLLADFIQVLDPLVSATQHVGLGDYWADLAEAGSGGDLGSRAADQALRKLDAMAAPLPEWILFDLACISDLKGWEKQAEARAALLGLAAKHARAQIAAIASVMWHGSTPAGMTGDLRDLLLAVRTAFNSDIAYLEWGWPIVAGWVPVLLAGTKEMSDRGRAMVEALREVALPHNADSFAPVLATLLDSKERRERVAGYLWTCTFAAIAPGEAPLDIAFEREIAEADEWGTPWALLWLAQALIAVLEAMAAKRTAATDKAAARALATLRKLSRYWEESPEKDPHGEGQALIHGRLGDAVEGAVSASEHPGQPARDAARPGEETPPVYLAEIQFWTRFRSVERCIARVEVDGAAPPARSGLAFLVGPSCVFTTASLARQLEEHGGRIVFAAEQGSSAMRTVSVPRRAPRVFLWCAPIDANFLEELRVHLAPRVREGTIALTYDLGRRALERKAAEAVGLKRADLVVLLVSTFSFAEGLEEIVRAAQARSQQVILVRVRSFEAAHIALDGILHLPRGRGSLSPNARQREADWASIVAEIERSAIAEASGQARRSARHRPEGAEILPLQAEDIVGIVELSEAVGEDVLGDGERRGWLRPVSDTVDAGGSLFIVCPGWNREIPAMRVDVRRGDDRRLYYRAGELRDFPGAPCFSSAGELVAMHLADERDGGEQSALRMTTSQR